MFISTEFIITHIYRNVLPILYELKYVYSLSLGINFYHIFPNISNV